MSTPDLEFVWACGLFEGEGTVGVYSNGNGYKAVNISVVMADLDVLERFALGIDFPGVIDGPYLQVSARKPLYRWRARGARQEKGELLQRMVPYLGKRRREQVRVFLEYAMRPRPKYLTGIRGPRKAQRDSNIRAGWHSGMSADDLARAYKLTKSRIYQIVSGGREQPLGDNDGHTP